MSSSESRGESLKESQMAHLNFLESRVAEVRSSVESNPSEIALSNLSFWETALKAQKQEMIDSGLLPEEPKMPIHEVIQRSREALEADAGEPLVNKSVGMTVLGNILNLPPELQGPTSDWIISRLVKVKSGERPDVVLED
jgi:hypothetical protein